MAVARNWSEEDTRNAMAYGVCVVCGAPRRRLMVVSIKIITLTMVCSASPEEHRP